MKARLLTLLSLIASLASEADTVTVETHVVPHYLGDLFGIQVNDRYTSQSNLFANLSLTDNTSVTLGTWHSWPVDGTSDDWGNEHDYYAYIHQKVEEWKITLGGTYYTLLEGNQLQLHGNISRTWGEKWTTTFSAWHSIPFEGLDFEGGTHLAVGLSRNFELSRRWNLNILGSTFYDSGVYGMDNGFFAQSKIRLAYDITDSFQFETGINAHLPLTTHDDRYTDAVFIVGFRQVFNHFRLPKLFGR